MPATSTPTLPPQISPPQFALSGALPHALRGVDVVALPVLPGDDGVLLGPGADALGDRTGLDLLGSCEIVKATGKTGIIDKNINGFRYRIHGCSTFLIMSNIEG